MVNLVEKVIMTMLIHSHRILHVISLSIFKNSTLILFTAVLPDNAQLYGAANTIACNNNTVCTDFNNLSAVLYYCSFGHMIIYIYSYS